MPDRLILLPLIFGLSAVPALAVPKLRLSTTVIGPVSALPGAAPAARELEVFGVGERGLNTDTAMLRLTFGSTTPWVSAAAGAARNCSSREGQCIPVRLSFATQSLATGAHSATVTVRDPGAIDAPQNILVLVNVGSNLPDRVSFYVAPNGSTDTFEFKTNGNLAFTATTQGGGDWLSLTLNTTGSFSFVQPYRITARHLSGLPDGAYTGSLQIRSAGFTPDNKTVAVSMQVTRQPIASVNPASLRVRLAQNSTRLTRFLRVTNRGMGTMSVTGATATTVSGGNWLSAEKVANADVISAVFDTSGVAPGVYRGSIAVQSNGVNNPLSVPVELEVVGQESPAIRFQGVLENAVFQEGDVLAAGGIVAAFGEQFSYAQPQSAPSLPLPADLGGTRVFVNDQPAPVYYVSYDQVNFQIPYDVRLGEGAVRIDRGGQRGNQVSAVFFAAAPKILRLRLRDAGLNLPEHRDFFGIAVHADGTLSLPTELGIPGSRPSRPGEALVLYLLAMGQTDPAVTAGAAAPSSPLARVASSSVVVYFGALALTSGATQEALFAGLSPGFVGLYQVNVVVPSNSPSGDVPVRVQLDTVTSEYALIAVE